MHCIERGAVIRWHTSPPLTVSPRNGRPRAVNAKLGTINPAIPQRVIDATLNYKDEKDYCNYNTMCKKTNNIIYIYYFRCHIMMSKIVFLPAYSPFPACRRQHILMTWHLVGMLLEAYQITYELVDY